MSDRISPQEGTGWLPDRPEDRPKDFRLYRQAVNINALAENLDTLHLMPEPWDQDVVGACTGYSISAVIRAIRLQNGHRNPAPASPVGLYLNGRILGGYPELDCGAELRYVWKGAEKVGIVPMSKLPPRFRPDLDLPDPVTWKFPEKSRWRRALSPSNFAAAQKRQMLVYYRINNLAEALQSLAEGYPVNFGFPVFRSFYGISGPRYDVPDPMSGETNYGGHAVVLAKANRSTQRVECFNSWGPHAHEGRPTFTLSFNFMERFASDMWTGRLVEGEQAAAVIADAKADAAARAGS